MKNRSTLKKVLKYIGKYKYLLPVSILFAIATVALTLYVPILIGDAIDQMTGKGEVDLERVAQILLVAVVLIGATALCQWLMSMINNRIAYHVARDVRRDAFAKIEKLPLSYLDTHSHGDLLSRTVNDTEQFSEGLLLGFTQLFTGIMTILGTLGLLLVLEWRVAIVVVVLTPLSLFVARFIAKKTYSMFKEQSSTKGEQTALIDEMIGNQKVVKAFGYEDKAVKRFNDVNSRLGKCSLRAIFFSSLVNPTTRFVNSVVYAAVALSGALIAIGSGGVFTVGTLSVLLSYANQYTEVINLSTLNLNLT